MTPDQENQFRQWCADIRERYQSTFGIAPPSAPNLVTLSSPIQERMLRCAQEARAFGMTGEMRDSYAVLAYHTLLVDDLSCPPLRKQELWGMAA